MRRRRSCRSARAPEPAWMPGSAGCAGSPKILAEELILLQLICNSAVANDLQIARPANPNSVLIRRSYQNSKFVVGQGRNPQRTTLCNTCAVACESRPVDNARRREETQKERCAGGPTLDPGSVGASARPGKLQHANRSSSQSRRNVDSC